jgi:hypothetical protein
LRQWGLRGRRPPKNIFFLALVVGEADHERQKNGGVEGEALYASRWHFASSIVA